MVEGGIAGESTSASASSSRLTSSFVKIGDRTRFTVELRPGETTIVSWKKLSKDAAIAEGAAPSAAAAASSAAAAASSAAAASAAAAASSAAAAASSTDAAAASAAAPVAVSAAPQPVPNSLPALESCLSPGQPAANELEDAPAPNRFNAVIEKIERLYTGKDSSDEEELADIPDDDQYDTEDSFIDDAELDEYFEVDKSKTKHDGYFVNRGMLEKVNESVESANQQPKKRRRKEVAKAPGDNPDGQRASKNLKVGKKAAGKSALSADKGILPTSQGSLLKSSGVLKVQNHQKITAASKPSLDPSPSPRMSHVDTLSALAENSDKKAGMVLPKISSAKVKEASENGDKNEYLHRIQSLETNHIEVSKSMVQQKDESCIRERIDLNLPDDKQPIQPMLQKNSGVKKEGSGVKPKANLLEKAVRELEKMVAESRPPVPDVQQADSSGQAIKRRLLREIKQKLGKVARLAHASNGKVSNELLNRLMGILGHLIQLRTLKRHLKIMMTMNLSAKQEKDDKFQLTKKEVIEMIKARIPALMSEAAKQQGGGYGDFQESDHPETAVKGLCMDTTLEDKICDLYDIFVDGLDEDATPQVRKLYAELAELWPKGVMDNHGIKRAICRAKERKRILNEKNKDQEKVRKKKVPSVNAEEVVRVESTSAVQSQQYVDVRVVSDPGVAGATQQNTFSAITSNAPAPAPAPTISTATGINPPGIASSVTLPSTDLFTLERLNQEKAKATQKNSLASGKIVDMGVKKKVKKKAEHLTGELPLRPDKLSSHQGDDRQKQHKQVSGQLQNVPVSQVKMSTDLSH